MTYIHNAVNAALHTRNPVFHHADIVKEWSLAATLQRDIAAKVQRSVMSTINNLQQPGRYLQRLDLSACGLTSLPPTLIWQQLEGITILDLSDNALPGRELEKLSALTSLQQLYLSGNPLKTIPESALGRQDNMAILDVDECQLHELSQNILTLHELDTLCLRGNPLHSLPDSLGYSLPRLGMLDIRNTAITGLPDSLQLLDHLTVKR